MNLIDEDKIKNDNWGPQSSGIRADFWNLNLWKLSGLGGTLIYFDDGGTYNWTDDPDNAVAAMELGVYGIDVCSGIEARPGKKDHKKMKKLFDNIAHLRA